VVVISVILSSNKLQSGDILVSANVGLPGKMAVKTARVNSNFNAVFCRVLDIVWLRSECCGGYFHAEVGRVWNSAGDGELREGNGLRLRREKRTQ